MLRLSTLVLGAVAVVLAAFTVRLGGSGTPTLPDAPYDYDGITLPSHLAAAPIQAEDNTPASNPITDVGATLGRVLFHDVRLSQNETIACSSCHLQDRGFSDPDRFSEGFEGERTTRNSMGLAFARFYDGGEFFWDERAGTLEDQVLMPIQDHVEMGMTLDEAVSRLEATAFYPGLFADAFGTPDVTSERVSRALAQFVRSIVAPNSRYDAARQAQGGPPGRRMAGLTDQENDGLDLFFGPGRCAQCHRGDLFVGDQARNNGLDATITDEGAGNGRFKTGSLRNVALTAPYMHDGRFETLADVVDHYSTGIQDSPNLDARLRERNGRPIRPSFTAAERDALVAFLLTLTDETLATDPRWSDPFAASATSAAATPSAPVALDLAGPNPVRDATSFRVRLGTPGPVRLGVFDAAGRRVATLLDGSEQNEVTVHWRPGGVAPGIYHVRLVADGAVTIRTVTVVR